MWQRVCAVEDLPFAQPKCYRVAGERIVLVKMSDTKIYAFMDVCSHQDLPLSGGKIEGKSLVCPAHGAKFDLETGAAQCLPATAPIERLPVRIEGKDVQVELG